MNSNITIQSRRDHQYLGAPGKWQANREQAVRFPSSLDAVKYCVRENLKNVQIVFSFDDPKFDFAVQVDSR